MDPLALKHCAFCNAITRMIQTPLRKRFSEHVEVSDDDAVSRNCKVHEPLLLQGFVDNSLARGRPVRLWKDKGQSIFRIDNTKLHLVRRDDMPGHCGMGRVIQDKEWIDIDVIKGFLENCIQRHGKLCDNFPFGDIPEAVAIPRPTFLIDAEAWCIVDTSNIPAEKPFVTLSYTRGSDIDDYLCLTKLNVSALQQPSALAAPDIASRIPRTFCDAISLAPLLGIHYIWIDLLCVVQDDDSFRQSEAAKTGFISAAATFVIAECDGTDASHGIRGIRGIPCAQPRSFSPKWVQFGEHEAFIHPSGDERSHAVESHRAWLAGTTYPFQAGTFAETVLARRVLRFEMGTVQWRCQSYPCWSGDATQDEHMWEDCAHYCERARWGCQMDLPSEQNLEWEEEWSSDDSDDDGPSNKQRPHWTAALSKPWPGVPEYYAMLQELTEKRTVDPRGMLDVSAGLTAAFARRFEGRIFFGLPETCFDLALLWRIPAQSIRSAGPSWSWIGWTSPPHYPFPWSLSHSPEMDGVDHVAAKPFSGVEIVPLIKWSLGVKADAPIQDRLALQSWRWHEAREAFREASTPLPPGWTREKCSLEPGARSWAPRGYQTNTVCRFGSAEPRNLLKSFWYPIPMRNRGLYEGDSTRSGNPQEQIINQPFAYLFGTMELSRQQFYIHRSDWPPQAQGDTFANRVTSWGESYTGTHVLRDENGKFAGALDMYEQSHGGREGEGLEQTPLDLIAISRGLTRPTNQGYEECDARLEWERDDDTKYYEFYNVLWVAWLDDATGANVASRRGLGRVSREAWEKATKERLEIVLA